MFVVACIISSDVRTARAFTSYVRCAIIMFTSSSTTLTFDSSVYSTPTVANGTLFVSDRNRLYAFTIQ